MGIPNPDRGERATLTQSENFAPLVEQRLAVVLAQYANLTAFLDDLTEYHRDQFTGGAAATIYRDIKNRYLMTILEGQNKVIDIPQNLDQKTASQLIGKLLEFEGHMRVAMLQATALQNVVPTDTELTPRLAAEFQIWAETQRVLFPDTVHGDNYSGFYVSFASGSLVGNASIDNSSLPTMSREYAIQYIKAHLKKTQEPMSLLASVQLKPATVSPHTTSWKVELPDGSFVVMSRGTAISLD